MGADLETRSIALFEADFQQGTKVQIMLRDNQMMMDLVREHSEELLRDLGTKRPILGLCIDCAGRCSTFSGAETKELRVFA